MRGDVGPRIERLDGGHSFHAVGIPDLSPVFETRREGETWLAKRLTKLPPTRQPRHRPCLRCGTEFYSEGAHHRMCAPCGRASGALETPATIYGARMRRVTGK